ncbi:MAG TPA: hypothetical protein EYP25_03280 [Anaerolineae bacterium]|nr:hypothetical protein [Anaerolineae bacterium]
MNVIGAIFFFICLSFIIVIFGVVVMAVYLKNKMTVFKEVQMEHESYYHEPYKDADFHAIGQERTERVEIVDAEYHVLPGDEEPRP